MTSHLSACLLFLVIEIGDDDDDDSSLQQLTGARRWSPRCENLQDQIVGYLRECLTAESRESDCRLLVE